MMYRYFHTYTKTSGNHWIRPPKPKMGAKPNAVQKLLGTSILGLGLALSSGQSALSQTPPAIDQFVVSQTQSKVISQNQSSQQTQRTTNQRNRQRNTGQRGSNRNQRRQSTTRERRQNFEKREAEIKQQNTQGGGHWTYNKGKCTLTPGN